MKGFFGSLIYTVLFFLSVLVFGFMVLLPSLIINERNRWRLVTAFAQTNIFMCKCLCGLEHEVVGLKNAPKEPCVVFLKHSSVYEMFFALSFLPKPLLTGIHFSAFIAPLKIGTNINSYFAT